jgi:hypothetical protein
MSDIRDGDRMSIEQWLPVVGHEGLYDVSNMGQIYSRISQKILKPEFNPTTGKLYVTLTNPRRHIFIHTLVLEAFVGSCPDGMQCCHYNDIGTDNRLENLRWDTPSANNIDAVRNGLNWEIKKTHCPKKHEYTIENTKVHKGKRYCRKCYDEMNKGRRMLFKNDTHRDIWIEKWCHTCYEPHEAARRIQGKDTCCPILEKALRENRKAPQWDRNMRADEMHRTIKCNAYMPKPPMRKREQHFEDVAMFDVEPEDVDFVPVEGWPEKPKKGKDVDHA